MINSMDELRQLLADGLDFLSKLPKPVLAGLVTAVTRIEGMNGHHFDVSLWDGTGPVKVYSFAGKADAGQGGSAADPTLLPVQTGKVTLDATPPSGTRELWLLNSWTEG